MTKIDIEQIKADREADSYESDSRRVGRLNQLEDALIEAVDTLEAILKCTPFITVDIGDQIAFDCGNPYDLARNFLERFK